MSPEDWAKRAISRMHNGSGLVPATDKQIKCIAEAIRKAVEKERQACALIAKQYGTDNLYAKMASLQISKLILNQGEKP